MKNIKKIAIILILLTVTIMCINSFVLAVDNPDYYEPSKPGSEDNKKAGEIIGNILANVRTIGILISVIMLTIIGLKYIICSAEEKSNYKENMILYIAGCFLLASATTIPSLVYSILN